MTADKLSRLAALAGLVADSELARLAEAAAERRAAEAILGQSREDRAAALRSSAPDAAHITGTADRWLDLNHTRILQQTAAVATAAAVAEARKSAAGRAFGRAEALKNLAKKATRR